MKIKSTSKAFAKALSSITERGFRASIQLRSLRAARAARAASEAFLARFISASQFICVSAAALSLLMAGLCPANAGEPCHWDRLPNKPAPFQFDTYHGESIDFRCTFVGFSSLPFGSGDSSPRLYYQTNGMAAAWWDIPATVSTTVVTNCPQQTANYQLPTTNYSLSATFPPSADPGAERLTVFFGAPSNAYAAAQVRFRNSPGATPNLLPPPSVIDWLSQLTSATSALMSSACSYTDSAINSLSKSFAPTISNTVTKAYVESLGIESGISAATATNIANSATNFLTRAEAIAGYTEWRFDVPYETPSIDNDWLTLLSVNYKNTLEKWEVLFKYWNDEWIYDSFLVEGNPDDLHLVSSEEYNLSLSRHRITPTSLSQLTNDVGYVTSAITNSLSSTNYVNNALTNRPTKAEMDEGWWSENFTLSGIPHGATSVNGPDFVPGITPMYSLFFTYNGFEYEGWTDVSGEDVVSVIFDCTDVDDLAPHITVTATRHRVAAPVPTKISDLTNDVGYATSTITNSLASTNYVNSATNALLSSACSYTDAVATNILATLRLDRLYRVACTSDNGNVVFVGRIMSSTNNPSSLLLFGTVQQTTGNIWSDWVEYEYSYFYGCSLSVIDGIPVDAFIMFQDMYTLDWIANAPGLMEYLFGVESFDVYH